MLLSNYFLFCIHSETQISHEQSQDKMGTKIGTRINKMVCNYCLLCISCPSDIQISYEQRHLIMSDFQKQFLLSAYVLNSYVIGIQISFSEATPWPQSVTCFRTCQNGAFWAKRKVNNTFIIYLLEKFHTLNKQYATI